MFAQSEFSQPSQFCLCGTAINYPWQPVSRSSASPFIGRENAVLFWSPSIIAVNNGIIYISLLLIVCLSYLPAYIFPSSLTLSPLPLHFPLPFQAQIPSLSSASALGSASRLLKVLRLIKLTIVCLLLAASLLTACIQNLHSNIHRT